jgi:hypothetical protein
MQNIHLVKVWNGDCYCSTAFVKESDRDPNVHTVVATLSHIELARKLAAELNDIADQFEETANV